MPSAKGEADGSEDPSMQPDKRGRVRSRRERHERAFRPSENPHDAIVVLYHRRARCKRKRPPTSAGGLFDRPSGAEGIRTPDPHNAIVVLYQN